MWCNFGAKIVTFSALNSNSNNLQQKKLTDINVKISLPSIYNFVLAKNVYFNIS